MSDDQSLEAIDHEPTSAGIRFLQTYLLTVWQFRKLVLLGTATLASLFVIWATVAYIRQPVVDTAVLVFRPTFEGARYSSYPNGTPFSPTDITSPSVLQRTFERNNLSQFLTFEQFARSVSVVPSGARAATLAIEYEAKLAEPRITPVDRQKLEAEYFSRLEALPVEYKLLFANTEHKYRVPGTLMQKVMADILADWADEAVNTRGVVLYNREVITNVFSEADQKIPDLLQRTDVLRQRILRIIDTVERLNKLPGGQTMRGGKQNLTFAEIAVRLSELVRYELEPLYANLRRSGLIPDNAAAISYLTDQIARVQLDLKEHEDRRKAVAEAFRTYLGDSTSAASALPRASADSLQGVAPQLSDSFLDKLVNMSKRQEDMNFRQGVATRLENEALAEVQPKREFEFYKSAIAAVRAPAVRQATPEARQAAINQLEATQKTAVDLSSEVREIFATLSTTNLNPQGKLYIFGPDATFENSRALTVTTLFTYLLLVVFAATILGLSACGLWLIGRSVMNGARSVRAA